jgi:hypothetical protein
MQHQETETSQKLREMIAENPERSFAIAAIGGFVVGGGLSSRMSFRILLMGLEAMIGDRLLPAMMAAGNGKHSAGNGHTAANGMDRDEQRRSPRNKK